MAASLESARIEKPPKLVYNNDKQGGIMRCTFLLGSVIFVLTTAISADQGTGKKPVECDDPKYKKTWEEALIKYPLPNNATELIFQYSFPDEKLAEQEIFLWGSNDFAMNGQGRIYVLDQKSKHLLQFDQVGKYLRTIGRGGQGPGEMAAPLCVCSSDESIYVIDNGNRNIQRYTCDGNFIESKKTSNSYSDMVWNPSGYIYAAPIFGPPEQYLVDVLDAKGEYIKSIIKPNDSVLGLPRQIPVVSYLGFDGKRNLYVAFLYHPLVIKSDTEGAKIEAFKIEYEIMKEQRKTNLDLASKKLARAVPIIEGIQGRLGGGFYILHGSPRAEILEFDAGGKMIHDYWHTKLCNYRASGFIVDEKNGKFYFNQLIPEFKIDVFRPNDDKK